MSSRHRLVLGVGLAALAAVAHGCAPSPAHPERPGIEALREAAAERPRDPAAAKALALAEAFDEGSDPARVEPALSRALELSPRDPALTYTRALVSDVRGNPGVALDGYLRTIELASASAHPDAQALIQVASYAVLGQSGMTRGYADVVQSRLRPVLEGATLSAAARAALGDVLMPLAFRRGDPARIRSLARSLGCAETFRVAGPFGPRELLGFDESLQVEPANALQAEYDLGAGRGRRPTRTVETRGCSALLGGGPVADGGVTWAETEVRTAAAGEYLVRVDTPNSFELYVDGKSVLRVDRRRALGSRVMFHRLHLPAGDHRVMVAVATRHPNPVLELAVTPLTAADGGVAADAPLAGRERGFPLHVGVAVALSRGDVLSARQALSFVGDRKDVAALLLMQRAAVALSDPLVPDEVRSDDARRLFARAAERDPRAWAPFAQLASLAAQAGRTTEAIEALKEARERWPQVPSIGLLLAEQLRGKGFQAAAEHEIERLREQVPDACSPIAAELEMKRARQRYGEAMELARALVACDAETNALYSGYLEQRDYGQAKRELARLTALQTESQRYGALLAELALAKHMGDEAGVWAAIHELRERYPRSFTGALEEFDALYARGKKDEARKALHRALEAEPASMAEFHRIARALLREHALAGYRKDGLAAIEAFEASGKTYDGPQVLVLDYMAGRIFEDGSSLELVHTVQRAQSDESVNELGEVHVPEGAEILTLRSIKPDGRTLEPDSIAGKDTISMPSLARGDYVEVEYVRANPPAQGFPGGYLGDRFYFKSFEVPFHFSQMVVALPKSMDYAVDPRGPAPKAKETIQGELRVLDFTVEESVPLVEEPNSVASREFIPSVRVGVRATFPAMVDSLRDILIDRDLYDPYFASLAKRIVGDAKPDDFRLRAERLYGWVLENIENSNDVFAQASLMLRGRTGNRARVLRYLMRLAGVPAELALVRNFTSDATESDMADGDTYDQLMLRVDLPKQEPIWLFTVERWAPFGFIPATLRGQPALMLQAGAPETRVSQGLLGPDSRDFKVQVELRKDGSARVHVVETLHGTEAVSWRSQLEQIPAAELERRIEQDYVARLFPSASLVSLEIHDQDDVSADLRLEYVAEVGSLARQVEKGLSLASILPSELAANYARTSSRKTTELIAHPVRTTVEVSVSLPPGIAAPAPVPPVSLTAKLPGSPSFTETITTETDAFTVRRSLTVPRARVAPNEYPVLAEFSRRVDAVEDREIVLPARQ